jgi:hypothetical protein
VVDGRLETFSAPFRYVWPSELDLMACLARHAAAGALGGAHPGDNRVVWPAPVWDRPGDGAVAWLEVRMVITVLGEVAVRASTREPPAR